MELDENLVDTNKEPTINDENLVDTNNEPICREGWSIFEEGSKDLIKTFKMI